MTQATETKKLLEKLEKRNWSQETGGVYEPIEEVMREVVENGTFVPDVELVASLNLTLQERVSGKREQNMGFVFSTGLMLGAALEQDVPTGSKEEDLWREGEFEL